MAEDHDGGIVAGSPQLLAGNRAANVGQSEMPSGAPENRKQY